MFFLRAVVGFSCSLDVLYGGLGIRKQFQLIFFLQFFYIKTPDPDPKPDPDSDPDSLEMLDPYPD
jgi:hypothetical protein